MILSIVHCGELSVAAPETVPFRAIQVKKKSRMISIVFGMRGMMNICDTNS
jgi:hypothetical protein